MIPHHAPFLQAIQEKKQVWIKFYSLADSGVLEQTCTPIEYAPGTGFEDGLNRYWFGDFVNSPGSKVMGLLPQQVLELQVLGEQTKPAQTSPPAITPDSSLKNAAAPTAPPSNPN